MPEDDPEWLEVFCVVGVVIIAEIGTREVGGNGGFGWGSTLGDAMVAGADAGAGAGEGAAEGPGIATRGVTADSLLTNVPAAAAALDSAAFAWASALVGRPRLRFACAPGVAEACGMTTTPP